MTKVINLLWGYSFSGITKVVDTYSKLNDSEGIQIYTICVHLAKIPINLKSIEKSGIKLIIIKNRRDLSWINKLKTEILSYRPDKLMVHGFNGPVIGFFIKAKWLKKLPLICVYHGEYHAPTLLKKIAQPLFNLVPHLIYKLVAEKVITVESYSRKFLSKKFIPENKIITIHNGIQSSPALFPIELDRYGLKENIITIGLASRLDPVKGVKYLIEAVKILKYRNLRPFQVVIIGDGKEKDLLIHLVENYELQELIHFLGFQAEVGSWMEKFDIFVLPSLAEYHSIGLLEAMRSGKAIIATKVGGNPESITNGSEGILVPPKNSESIANAIESLIIDPMLRDKLGKAAKEKFALEFTEEITLKKLASVLSEK